MEYRSAHHATAWPPINTQSRGTTGSTSEKSTGLSLALPSATGITLALILIRKGNFNWADVQRPFERGWIDTFGQTEPFRPPAALRLRVKVPNAPLHFQLVNAASFIHIVTLDAASALLKVFPEPVHQTHRKIWP
jgi:hypothetical protein